MKSGRRCDQEAGGCGRSAEEGAVLRGRSALCEACKEAIAEAEADDAEKLEAARALLARSRGQSDHPSQAELIERLGDWARVLDRVPAFLAKSQYERIYDAAFRTSADIRECLARLEGGGRRKRLVSRFRKERAS